MMRDTRGDMLPFLGGIGLFLSLVFLIGFQFVRAGVITGGVRNAMKSEAEIAVTQNNFNAYASLREGLDGAYTVDSAGQVHDNAVNMLKQDLIAALGLQESGDQLVKTTDGQPAYRLSDFNVQVSNPDIRATGAYKVTATSSLSIAMPLHLPSIPIPLSVDADFQSKF